jgi:hypothetical protein
VQVPAYWVAQLQMEMLASGTHSIVLLSRSATKVLLGYCVRGLCRLKIVLEIERASIMCAR